MSRPKILVIQTGGTIIQKRGPDGVYRPSDENPLEYVKGVYELADIETEKPANLDSTNITTAERAHVAEIIYNNRLGFDGFVVTHGTDTMVDTAAALTYMVSGLGKPIILTGSQKPIFEPGTDAVGNLYYAVQTATRDIGEVAIAFGDVLIRGTRAKKTSEDDSRAFDSPRCQPIGRLGGMLTRLGNHRIKRYTGDPMLFTEFDTNIEMYPQPSGTSTDMFRRYAEDPDVHGIIVIGYGAGNVQSRLIPHIERASADGKPVLVTTVCDTGSADIGLYEVGSDARKAGAISGLDLTQSAAVQKLMFAIGIANAKGATGKDKIRLVEDIMHQPYGMDIEISASRGEELFTF